jgi:hypothetical protein
MGDKSSVGDGELESASGFGTASIIVCPACGARHAETMPTDACVYFYDCPSCGARLKPKSGDCCVFCSYGTVPCPPVQQAKADSSAQSCCR